MPCKVFCETLSGREWKVRVCILFLSLTAESFHPVCVCGMCYLVCVDWSEDWLRMIRVVLRRAECVSSGRVSSELVHSPLYTPTRPHWTLPWPAPTRGLTQRPCQRPRKVNRMASGALRWVWKFPKRLGVTDGSSTHRDKEHHTHIILL